MLISNRSVFLHWLTNDSVTSRTAVYGPVRTVVWQGSAGNRCPYADQVGLWEVTPHASMRGTGSRTDISCWRRREVGL
jgi:hypothetical protein